jgi:hypothetical protein
MNRCTLVTLGVLTAALALAQVVKPPTYSISGAGPQFALFYLSGGPTQVRPISTSGKPPQYQFTSLAPGVYTVRPERQNCTFQPPERTVTITNSNVTGIDFTNTCTPPKKGPPGQKQ